MGESSQNLPAVPFAVRRGSITDKGVVVGMNSLRWITRLRGTPAQIGTQSYLLHRLSPNHDRSHQSNLLLSAQFRERASGMKISGLKDLLNFANDVFP